MFGYNIRHVIAALAWTAAYLAASSVVRVTMIYDTPRWWTVMMLFAFAAAALGISLLAFNVAKRAKGKEKNRYAISS